MTTGISGLTMLGNNSEPGIQCLDDLCASYDVIIFKHCFPGADILSR